MGMSVPSANRFLDSFRFTPNGLQFPSNVPGTRTTLLTERTSGSLAKRTIPKAIEACHHLEGKKNDDGVSIYRHDEKNVWVAPHTVDSLEIARTLRKGSEATRRIGISEYLVGKDRYVSLNLQQPWYEYEALLTAEGVWVAENLCTFSRDTLEAGAIQVYGIDLAPPESGRPTFDRIGQNTVVKLVRCDDGIIMFSVIRAVLPIPEGGFEKSLKVLYPPKDRDSIKDGLRGILDVPEPFRSRLG